MNIQFGFGDLSDPRPELHFLFSATDKEGKESVDIKDKKDKKKEKYIVCKECRNIITHHRHKINAQNSFQHTFLNPEGKIYLIGCFAEARGCAGLGIPAREWSWFRGFDWQTLLCVECLAHLGWRYSRTTGESFFGLILDALI